MKKFLLPFVALTWVAFWMLTSSTVLTGQTEAESATDLQIQNIKRPKTTYSVQNGRKVRVVLKDDRIYKGALTAVGDSFIRVDSLEFAYKDMEMLRVPNLGSVGAKISGLVLGIVGLVGFLLGFLMTLFSVNGLDNTTDCAELFGLVVLLILGIMIGAVGAAVFLIGLITFLIGALVGKAFRMDGKWRFMGKKSNP